IISRNIHLPKHPVLSLGRFSTRNDSSPPRTSSPQMKLFGLSRLRRRNSESVAVTLSGSQLPGFGEEGLDSAEVFMQDVHSLVRPDHRHQTRSPYGCTFSYISATSCSSRPRYSVPAMAWTCWMSLRLRSSSSTKRSTPNSLN